MSLKSLFAVYVQGGINVKLNPNDATHSNEILIIQLSALGDACTLIPFVQQLEKSNSYHINLICKEGLEALWLEFCPSIIVVPVKKKSWSSRVVKQQLRLFNDKSFKAIFVTSIDPYAAFISCQMNAEKRYGMIEHHKYYKGSRLIYNKVYNADKNEHVTNRFKNLFSHLINLDLNFKQTSFFLTENHQEYVLIHPGAKWKPRRWPKECYGELVKKLNSNGISCKILINKSERDLHEFFLPFQNNTCKIVHTSHIHDLIEAIKGCKLFIGNDSGPAHLANLLIKQTIVLWGPGNFERIHPKGENVMVLMKEIECRPCLQYKDQEKCQIGENKCLTLISSEEVFQVAMSKLK